MDELEHLAEQWHLKNAHVAHSHEIPVWDDLTPRADIKRAYAAVARTSALKEAAEVARKAAEPWAGGSVYHQFAMDMVGAILALDPK